jgi:hypothetical protein
MMRILCYIDAIEKHILNISKTGHNTLNPAIRRPRRKRIRREERRRGTRVP